MLRDKPIAELLKETNRVLNMAVDKGLKDNRPPQVMMDKLRDDVFVFSACKTHVELKELGSRLITPDGKVSSWNRFLSEATALHGKYNEDYLQAEYIFATSSAEMAARWDDVSKDGERYNLQYRTAGDDRVRDAHDRLRGTTLPASDPFWDSYYPPNGWRCRCTAVQVLKEKYPVDNSAEKIKIADAATTQIDSKGRDRGAMFRFNPGKQQVIFPPKHPYYKVKESLGSIIGSLPSPKAKLIEERRQDYQKLRKDKNYFDVAFKEENGGLKGTHTGHQFDPKYGHFEKQTQDILFDNGHSVIFENESIHKYKVKIADGILDGQSFDISTIIGGGKNTVNHALIHSKKKNVSIAVLYFPDEANFTTNRLNDGIAYYEKHHNYRFSRIITIVGKDIK